MKFVSYQILDSYDVSMLKKHFKCSINFVDAKLKGSPRFHASTLVAVNDGISGLYVTFDESQNGTEPSITNE